MKAKITPGFAAKLAIITTVLLLAVNLFTGYILLNHSTTALKVLIQNRMLDISKTAADMLDGDILRTLTAEDAGSAEYQAINDTLDYFQRNINLKYIYTVRDNGDGSFSFMVDPDKENPGVFGEPVVYTEALHQAALGESSVDETPYSDAWGSFYSSYSPVFDSSGDVAGIVAVDFSADWYDAQIAKQRRSIIISTFISILIGILLVLVATNGLRKLVRSMTSELIEVATDVDELTTELNPDACHDDLDIKDTDDVLDLSNRIHRIKEELRKYTLDLHSQANSMITALSSEYRSVYYINLDDNEGICYQSHSQLSDGLQQGEHFSYINTFTQYANEYVTEKYREDFLKFIDPDTIRKSLLNETIITFRYMINRNGTESYEMVRMAGVRHPEDRDDHKVHAIGMGFADVDAETRRTLNQSQALKDALAAAEDANNAKTAFLSNMSHEIRTPMNAIIGLNRIALEDPELPERTREHLEKIGTSADHLLSLINDILDMSRIEAGRMSIKQEPFSLSKLLDQINVMISGQCRDKELKWNLEKIGFSEEYYIGDDMKLRQVIINILGNSVKFTPKGGRVSFVAEKTGSFDGKSAFRFVMADTGKGMSPDFLARLFEPFSQEEVSSGSAYGSTGLGMSITKSIIEMMNGEISVESEKGYGTTFTVSLTFKDSLQSEKTEEKAPAPQDTADLSGKHILVAEDVSINAQILQMTLSSKQMEMDHAENGRLALEMFEKSPEGYYDAILMDMRMPEMDGLEATKAIRSLSRSDAGSIPIIALTANAFNEDVQRSLQSGLNAHLSKPIVPEELFKTLGSLIKETP